MVVDIDGGDAGDGGDSECLSYFSVAVVKDRCQGNLNKNAFTWAYRSRGIGVHHGREAWRRQQEAELQAENKRGHGQLLNLRACTW